VIINYLLYKPSPRSSYKL
jgi:hypothetical protein